MSKSYVVLATYLSVGFLSALFVVYSNGAALLGSGPRVRISVETTAITGPMRDGGVLDYAAGYNNLLSEGIAADQNAAIPLAEAVGVTPEMGPFTLGDLNKVWNAELDPDVVPKLLRFDSFLEANGISLSTDKKVFKEQFELAMENPWSSAQSPELASWLEQNDEVIAWTIEAVERPHYFHPLVPTPGQGIVTSRMTMPQCMRFLIEPLLIEGLRAAELEDHARCAECLLAARRLTRHVGSAATLVEIQMAAALEEQVIKAERGWLKAPGLKAEVVEQYVSSLSSMPARGKELSRSLDVGFRFLVLDFAQSIFRRDPNAPAYFGNQFWTPAIIQFPCDFDHCLVLVNRSVDQLCDALADESGFDVAEWKALEDRLRRKAVQASNRGNLSVFTMTLEERSVLMSDLVVGNLANGLARGLNASILSQDASALNQIAIWLEGYRLRKGEYPDSLDDFEESVRQNLPVGVYRAELPTYERTAGGYVLRSRACDILPPYYLKDGARELLTVVVDRSAIDVSEESSAN